MAASRSRHAKNAAARRGGEVLITRKLGFCAAHRYENPSWSERKNRAVFGPCYNPHGHGHNYELEVTIRGPVDVETGMVLNLRTVDAILRKEVFERFDHRFINREVPGFDRINPTLENLCVRIWEILEPCFRRRGIAIHRVRLFESPDLYGEYLGEEIDS